MNHEKIDNVEENNDIEKLSEVIKELEESSQGIKEYKDACSEISKLNQEISNNLNLLQDNNNNLENISGKIIETIEHNEQFIQELKSIASSEIDKNNVFKEELKFLTIELNEKFIQELKSIASSEIDKNNVFKEELKFLLINKIDEMNKYNKEMQEENKNFFADKINEIIKSNKNFLSEFDSSLISRLDKHKSDIQVEIRNEGTQIQRAFENTLVSKFNTMESTLKEAFSEQSKKIKVLTIALIIFLIINISLIIWLVHRVG